MDFVAIDFETANSQRDSACALGAVVVRDGKIVDRRYTLLNPHQPFEKFCTYIHGITEETVVDSPDFSDIYPFLYKMLNANVVVAHNASFDVAVLRGCCEARGLPMPSFDAFCSVEMARKAWPELPHHRLNTLCTHFSLPLKHHNAVEDATACAMIVLKCAQEFSVSDFVELRKALEKKALFEARLRREHEAELLKRIELARSDLAHGV